MHKFLRAVGFSDIKKEQLETLFKRIIENAIIEKIVVDSEGNKFAEILCEFGSHFGIALRGIYHEDHSFELEYYYPYFFGKTVSTKEKAEIEKHAEKESYAGVICDEVRVGIVLIFYLQNVTEYLSLKARKDLLRITDGVTLAALSTEGKILLPIEKTEKQIRQISQENKERNRLIAAARDGDEETIESLTLEDMDTYSLLSRRVMHEDIFSIVDSCFMPYGIESDQYSILGEIVNCLMVCNRETKEHVYVLDIMCNDIYFALCINQKDLVGEPKVGRRFRGTVWMQGRVNYKI